MHYGMLHVMLHTTHLVEIGPKWSIFIIKPNKLNLIVGFIFYVS